MCVPPRQSSLSTEVGIPKLIVSTSSRFRDSPWTIQAGAESTTAVNACLGGGATGRSIRASRTGVRSHAAVNISLLPTNISAAAERRSNPELSSPRHKEPQSPILVCPRRRVAGALAQSPSSTVLVAENGGELESGLVRVTRHTWIRRLSHADAFVSSAACNLVVVFVPV